MSQSASVKADLTSDIGAPLRSLRSFIAAKLLEANPLPICCRSPNLPKVQHLDRCLRACQSAVIRAYIVCATKKEQMVE